MTTREARLPTADSIKGVNKTALQHLWWSVFATVTAFRFYFADVPRAKLLLRRFCDDDAGDMQVDVTGDW